MKQILLALSIFVVSSLALAYPGQRCARSQDCYSVVTGVPEVCSEKNVCELQAARDDWRRGCAGYSQVPQEGQSCCSGLPTDENGECPNLN